MTEISLREEFEYFPNAVIESAEATLRSASSLNGLVALNLADSRTINNLIETGFLREDEDGDVFLDNRGYEWLAEDGRRADADADSLAEERNARTREWRNHWASLG